MAKKNHHSDAVDESDRGCVLVVAANLELVLERLLKATFTKNNISKKVQESLFDSNGPLATFSGKLRIAFAFALISADDYADIDFIRKLRNEAAHNSEEYDLSEHPRGEQIDKLKCVQPYLGVAKRYNVSKIAKMACDSGRHESSTVRDVRLLDAGFIKVHKVHLFLGATDISARIYYSYMLLPALRKLSPEARELMAMIQDRRLTPAQHHSLETSILGHALCELRKAGLLSPLFWSDKNAKEIPVYFHPDEFQVAMSRFPLISDKTRSVVRQELIRVGYLQP